MFCFGQFFLEPIKHVLCRVQNATGLGLEREPDATRVVVARIAGANAERVRARNRRDDGSVVGFVRMTNRVPGGKCF